LLEEHAHCLSLYPSRAIELEREISQALEHSSWRADLPGGTRSVEAIGSFLCDIKESQIRSALHVLGEKPTGEREIDFLLSLVRMPSGDRPGLLEKLKLVEADDLTPAERDGLEAKARAWLSDVLKSAKGPPHRTEAERGDRAFGRKSNQELEVHSSPEWDLTRLRAFVLGQVIPRLSQCENELQNLIDGLNGRFVPPGPSGAPTRGRIDVLPTGRNFFCD
jgi:cobaltochelatase CobN